MFLCIIRLNVSSYSSPFLDLAHSPQESVALTPAFVGVPFIDGDAEGASPGTRTRLRGNFCKHDYFSLKLSSSAASSFASCVLSLYFLDSSSPYSHTLVDYDVLRLFIYIYFFLRVVW